MHKPGELGVCQVDAGDEKNAAYCGQKKPETSRSWAYDGFFERLDVGGERAAWVAVDLIGRNLTGDIVCDDVEIFRGLGERYAGLEAAECNVVAVVAVPSVVFSGINHERGDDLAVGELASHWRW